MAVLNNYNLCICDGWSSTKGALGCAARFGRMIIFDGGGFITSRKCSDYHGDCRAFPNAREEDRVYSFM